VNGFKEEMAGEVDVVHLNLVSAVGREVGRRYGVKIVPTTLLFDGQGNLITRMSGMPEKDKLIGTISLNGTIGRVRGWEE
jgi:thioredoxin-related protein